jgi:hypothetical protein
MCTVSWLPGVGGYTLFFNRDERLTRASSLPPSLREGDGVRFVAPLDGESGGTWIAVNEFGVTVSLLNRYGDPTAPPPAHPVSRGRLVLVLAAAADQAELEARLSRVDLSAFQPFTLVAAAAGCSAWLAAWNGRALHLMRHSAPGLILTSSAFDEPAVAASRRLVFAQGLAAGITAERLAALHRSHLPAPGPFSICMHRGDAETQSLSRITVTEREVRFAHVPDAPCRGRESVSLRLARRPPHAA